MLQYPPPTQFMVDIVVPLFSVWLFLRYIFQVRRICSTPYTTRIFPTASATLCFKHGIFKHMVKTGLRHRHHW